MTNDVVLRVRLTPRGGRDAFIRRADGLLYVRVAAPPIDGAANRALIAFLAKAFGIARSRITLVAGASAREKLLRIEDVDPAALEARLQELLEVEYIGQKET